MAGYIFAVAASVAVPLLACLLFSFRAHAERAILYGIACFVVFQCLLRMPLLEYVLPQFASYQLFQMSHPWLNLALVALSAGIFEECGRYLIMHRFLKESRTIDAVAFGFGHGGIEALLLVGLNLIFLPWINGYSAMSGAEVPLFLTGIERLLATAAHIGLSLLIWRAVTGRKIWILPLAVGLHTLFDFLPTALMQVWQSAWATEAIIAVMSVSILIFSFCLLGKNNRPNLIKTRSKE